MKFKVGDVLESNKTIFIPGKVKILGIKDFNYIITWIDSPRLRSIVGHHETREKEMIENGFILAKISNYKERRKYGI